MARERPLNLTAALTAAAVADLVLHRVISRLFLPQRPSDAVSRLATEAGRFAFHLGGVLGIVVVATALVLGLRRSGLFPRSMTVAVGVVALFFVTFATLGTVFLELPERFLVYLKTSQAFLACFIAAALWRGQTAVRAKVGVTLFALPPQLQAVALFAERAGWGGPFAGELARAAEICALFAGALAPYLVAPEPLTGGRRAAGLTAGAGMLAFLIVMLAIRFDVVQALALYGFRLDLPALGSAGALTYTGLVIAAFVGLSMAIVWALLDAGARLVGYGLVLVAAAGYQAIAPNQVLFATGGLLALAAGALRMPSTPAHEAPARATVTA
jgi:hypothetical protein